MIALRAVALVLCGACSPAMTPQMTFDPRANGLDSAQCQVLREHISLEYGTYKDVILEEPGVQPPLYALNGTYRTAGPENDDLEARQFWEYSLEAAGLSSELTAQFVETFFAERAQPVNCWTEAWAEQHSGYILDAVKPLILGERSAAVVIESHWAAGSQAYHYTLQNGRWRRAGVTVIHPHIDDSIVIHIDEGGE